MSNTVTETTNELFIHHFVYQVCPIKWDKAAGSLGCEEEEEEEWVHGGQMGVELQSPKREKEG